MSQPKIFSKKTTNPNPFIVPKQTKERRFENFQFIVHQTLKNYRKIGTEAERNDLLQEGFLSLWELINENQISDDDFKILATTKIESRLRAVRRYQNKTRRLLPRLVAFSLSTSQRNNESQKYENIYDYLEAEIKNLNPKQKRSITQFFGLEGLQMTAEEIAHQEGKSPRAIWARRRRGIQALRKNLNPQSRDS